MMDVKLLEKGHKLYSLTRSALTYDSLCTTLSFILDSFVAFISYEGECLASSEPMEITSNLNERLLDILSTQENICMERLSLTGSRMALVVPVMDGEVRIATVLILMEGTFEMEEIMIAEYATALLASIMVAERRQRETNLERARATIATLTPKELVGITELLEEMPEDEGVIVGSKIADRIHLTRSMIVNGLAKLEAGCLLQAKSAGMQGTWIRLVDRQMLESVIKEYQ